jgi:hypothetical protein
MLAWLSVALAAPPDPAAAEDVRALVQALYGPKADDRIAAAAALLHTPPSLVGELDPAKIACFQDPHPDACRWHNHAVYQLERVLIGLAQRSIDPASPYAATCDRSERVCPAIRALWALAPPQVGLTARGDDELPPGSPGAVRADRLEAEIHAALDRLLTALPPSDRPPGVPWGRGRPRAGAGAGSCCPAARPPGSTARVGGPPGWRARQARSRGRWARSSIRRG